MTGKSVYKERTRARIVDEAAAAMRALGSDGISVAALMKRAGLTHGGFYAHFASRDDLVAHAIDRMFQDSNRLLHACLGNDSNPEGLARLIDVYLSETALRNIDRGCPLPCLSSEASRMPATARARFEAGMTTFRSRVADALTAIGEREGEELARSMVAEMVGAMSMARAMSDEAVAKAQLAASRRSLKRRLGLAEAKAE